MLVWFSEELPELDGWPCVTPLDKALRRLRKVNLKQIQQAALALKHGQETELSTVLEQAEDWAMRLHSLTEEVRIHRWDLSMSPKIKNNTDCFTFTPFMFYFLLLFSFLLFCSLFLSLLLFCHSFLAESQIPERAGYTVFLFQQLEFKM